MGYFFRAMVRMGDEIPFHPPQECRVMSNMARCIPVFHVFILDHLVIGAMMTLIIFDTDLGCRDSSAQRMTTGHAGQARDVLDVPGSPEALLFFFGINRVLLRSFNEAGYDVVRRTKLAIVACRRLQPCAFVCNCLEIFDDVFPCFRCGNNFLIVE